LPPVRYHQRRLYLFPPVHRVSNAITLILQALGQQGDNADPSGSGSATPIALILQALGQQRHSSDSSGFGSATPIALILQALGQQGDNADPLGFGSATPIALILQALSQQNDDSGALNDPSVPRTKDKPVRCLQALDESRSTRVSTLTCCLEL
jgi:hypothetical protein